MAHGEAKVAGVREWLPAELDRALQARLPVGVVVTAGDLALLLLAEPAFQHLSAAGRVHDT